MLTRDSYVALLEKRAADAGDSSIPPNDSAEATHAEFNKIKEDDRQYLHSISSHAGEVQSNQTATVKKMFNNIPSGAIVGTTLMKVAFLSAVNKTNFIKQASPIHLELAFNSFKDELEKIAALKPQTLSQVAAKNQVAMSRPAKAWDIGGGGGTPISMGSPQSAMQGSGTSVHTGGILGRLGLR